MSSGLRSALALETRAPVTGCRLDLPKEWVTDPARGLAAGRPAEEIPLRPTFELARELVEAALANGWEFRGGRRCGSGRDPGFLSWGEDPGLGFVADAPTDGRVWEKNPPGLDRPAKRKARGARAVGKLGREWKAQGPGRSVTLREAENGPGRGQVWARRVWGWPAGESEARRWGLGVRAEREGDVKYTLLNSPATTPLEEVALLPGGRHFVERACEAGTSPVGLGDDPVRQGLGGQHPRALGG